MSAVSALAAVLLSSGYVVVPEYSPVDVGSLADSAVAEFQVDPSVAAAVAGGAVVGGWIGDVHPAWLVAVAAGETAGSFRVDAVGDGGRSLGLCQIQMRSARAVMPSVTREALLRPWWNVVIAGLLYGRLIRKFGRPRAHLIYGCGFRCSGLSTYGGRWKMVMFRRLVRRLGRNG